MPARSGYHSSVGSRPGKSMPAPGAPYFVLQPKDQFVMEGDNAIVVVQCDGDPSPKGKFMKAD